MPETMAIETVKITEMDVEVRSAGAGRPILFLHAGDGLEHELPALAALAATHRIIAPSHPGFGRSDLPPQMKTVDDLSYFYLDFLEAQRLEDVIVVGVSFGAWIAAEIAIKNTSRIAGLVLADAVGAKFGDRMTREIADLFAIPQYEQADILFEDPKLRQVDFNRMPDDVLLRLARNHQTFALFGWSPTLHNPKLATRLHRIDVPTLVLWGENDRVASAAYGQQFAQAIPGSSFELIPGAGHYPHIERPQQFVSAVERFVRALSA